MSVAMVISKLDKAVFGVYFSVSCVLQMDGVPEAVESRSFGGIRVQLDDIAKAVHSRLILRFPFVDVLARNGAGPSVALGIRRDSPDPGLSAHVTPDAPRRPDHF
jgi:hypothetical protein